MYFYETLSDERFQHLCQALITASFPNAQCLPVGQPDGGRDAYMLHHLRMQLGRDNNRDSIVFQVKFSRNPTEKTERQMIESVIKTEAKKVESLKKLGASKYYLLTNVSGTSHLEAGSIDRVNEVLSKALGIEAYCWWRDDLDRRLDAQSGIKWSYPETLKASDLLEKLISGQLGDEEDRRRSAIRAYMTSQFDEDQELKFKQTDLRSTMAELFVDLPIRFSPQSSDKDQPELPRSRAIRYAADRWTTDSHFLIQEDSFKAADYFINSQDFPRNSRIVLEGAPGQGKSTVTQFICQVLRMQLLNETTHLSALPSHFRSVPAKIPFRVDLRDLAKWLAGTDPFVSKPQNLPEQEPKSLEGFLAAQVRILSGGHSFDVADLTAVIKASHVLLALDGFDEVADITARQKLVDEIAKGTSRLINAGGFSLQTIVTSRPAAFAKSVRFPPEHWTYFELLPLEPVQIEEYTTKWTKAKGLNENQSNQLRAILEAKLKEAHTQFLAKNPMQLTILLSLINIRGASLPDKRTAMYDAYMDMFFSRESEKSEIVRDNRDLLIDIHRFLAWKLQAGAEAGENGSIEHSVLRANLFTYLDEEGEDTTIVGALFDGMIERVGALVSRVQGTYEFEVQPLREYFAARHLYETAPYPTDDKPATGDKFERFRALVCNPYWLNVARFYGGCFNKGEILTLVSELTELSRDEPFKSTSLPRSVSLMLLGDWVFSQYQPAVKQVLAFITEFPHIRHLLANAEASGLALWANLPDRSGRLDFVAGMWERLTTTSLYDEQKAIANAIVHNTSYEERVERWEALSTSLDTPNWTRIGIFLGMLSSERYLQRRFESETPNDELLEAAVNMRQFRPLDEAGLTSRARPFALSSAMAGTYRNGGAMDSSLNALATITSLFQYQLATSQEGDMPLELALEHHLAWEVQDKETTRDSGGKGGLVDEAEAGAIEAYRKFISRPVSTLSSSLAPWSEFVRSLREAWGDCPAVDRIAFIAAGVRSKGEVGIDVPLSETSDLVASARHIRLKSGAPKWWKTHLTALNTSNEVRRSLLVLILWGTTRTIVHVADELEAALAKLTERDWRILFRDFRAIRPNFHRDGDYISATDLLAFDQRNSRTLTFIAARTSSQIRLSLVNEIAQLELQKNSPEVHFAFQFLLGQPYKNWQRGRTLEFISKLYLRGAVSFLHDRQGQMDESVAKRVVASAEKLPLMVLAAADGVLTSAAGSRIPKLHEIAQSGRWFSDSGRPC